MLLEYEAVLLRDQQLANFWVAMDELEIILGILADRLQPAEINFRWRPQLRDPNDEMVLECAVNAGAKAIVTFNQRDFLPAATQFGLEVIPPKTGAMQNCWVFSTSQGFRSIDENFLNKS
jgi:predicted nucleic acid-binding protein